MQKVVLLVLTEYWADWEAAYAVAGINEKQGKHSQPDGAICINTRHIHAALCGSASVELRLASIINHS